MDVYRFKKKTLINIYVFFYTSYEYNNVKNPTSFKLLIYLVSKAFKCNKTFTPYNDIIYF